MNLSRELGGVTSQQERGLWKLVGLYRKMPANARSDRPLTLGDMARFRDQLTTQHPEFGTITDPHAWTLRHAERSFQLSPNAGKLRIDNLLRHTRQHPDEPQAGTFSPDRTRTRGRRPRGPTPNRRKP